MNSLYSFVVICAILVCNINAQEKEAFSKEDISTAVANIQKIRSDEQISSMERIAIREKEIVKIKSNITLLFNSIKSSPDFISLGSIVNDDNLFSFCIDFIIAEQEKLDVDTAQKVTDYIINNGSNSSVARYINKIILLDWPPERYTEATQRFIVANIKSKKVKFYSYFVLSDAEKIKLQDFLQINSKKMLIGKRSHSTHSTSLFSTILLASDGDIKAIDKLHELIDDIDINNNFDLFYIIVGGAVTKQQTLINQICTILKDDKREKFFGYDCMPQKITLKNEAAASLSLIDDNFPYTSFWDNTSSEHINRCIQWISKGKLNLNFDRKKLIKKISETRLNDL